MSRIPGTAVATMSSVPDAHHAPGDPLQAPVVEVLEQGVVGREGPHPQPGAHLDVLVVERRHAEACRQARFAFDLHDQHARARSRGRGGQSGGDGRLPYAALARHDHDSGGGAELRELHAPNATRGLRVLRMAGAVALVLASVGVASRSTPARQQPGPAAASTGSRSCRCEGLLDPPTASLLKNAIENANEQRRTMLVMQLNSRGTVDVDVQALVEQIVQSKVPVIAWAGPSGGEAKGGGTAVAAGVAQGVRRQRRVRRSGRPGPARSARRPADRRRLPLELGQLAERNGRDPDGAAELATKHAVARSREGGRRRRRCPADAR